MYSYREYNYTVKYLFRFHSVADCGKKLGSLYLIGLLSFKTYILESSWDENNFPHRTWTVAEQGRLTLAEHAHLSQDGLWETQC